MAAFTGMPVAMASHMGTSARGMVVGMRMAMNSTPAISGSTTPVCARVRCVV